MLGYGDITVQIGRQKDATVTSCNFFFLLMLEKNPRNIALYPLTPRAS